MKELTLDEIKKIELGILTEFINFCEEYNLRYVVDWGTLIGTIRHKGFIPWDDDIDITMPRRDYELFLNTFPKKGIITVLPDAISHLPYAKIVDNRTKTISPWRDDKDNTPIWIDIFPMDGMYASKEKTDKMLCITKKLNALHKLSFVKKDKLPPRKLLRFMVSLYKKVCPTLFLYLIVKIAQRNEYIENTNGVFYYIDKYAEAYCPPYFFAVVEKWLFEGIEVNVPKCWDERLKQVYGDFMTLPPEEERVQHSLKAYWIG